MQGKNVSPAQKNVRVLEYIFDLFYKNKLYFPKTACDWRIRMPFSMPYVSTDTFCWFLTNFCAYQACIFPFCQWGKDCKDHTFMVNYIGRHYKELKYGKF